MDSKCNSVAATVVSSTQQAAGQQELAGGAYGGTWRTLRELSPTNLGVISGVAVTKQLELALGVPTPVDISSSIVKEKTEHQQMVQEAFLKRASNSILYPRDL